GAGYSLVATSTLGVNLSDTAGTLTVSRGGIGWTNLYSGALLYGNGASAIATTSSGTPGNILALLSGVPTWTASTTFSSGLSYSNGNVTNSGVTSLGPVAQTLTGGISISTSTGSTNGITSAITVVGSGSTLTFTPAISGILTVGGGGTGSTTLTGLIKGNGTGVIQTALGGTDYEFPLTFGSGVARSANSITLNTSNTNTWAALQQFSNSSTSVSSVYGPAYFGATATSSFSSTGALTLASALGVSSGGTGATSFGQGWLFSTGGTNLLSASTSPTVNYITATSTTATSTFANGINITGGCFSVNGTCIGNLVKLTAIRSYVTNTSWSKPSNLSYVVVEVWGGGGGGGDGDGSGDGAGGGGGGGYSTRLLTASDLSATTSVFATIGAGGVVNGNSTGGTGGTSSFDTFLSATGGAGGVRANGAAAAGGTGGTGSSGDLNLTGEAGAPAQATWGAQGGGAPRGGMGGAGGGTAGTGGAGNAYGGGGGGGVGTGAAGATGGVVIYEYTTQLGGSDLAENYPVSDPSIGSGDIVVFDSGSSGVITRAVLGDDRPLVGIISTNPGIVLGDKNALGQRPVALSGRVPVKISLEGGPIKVGDRIALSSIPGVGRKASSLESSVGIALDSYLEGNTNETLNVFIDLGQGVSEGFFSSLFDRLKKLLADATNGLVEVFAKRIHTEEICLKKTDGNEICLNGDRLEGLLNNPEKVLPPTMTSSMPVENISVATTSTITSATTSEITITSVDVLNGTTTLEVGPVPVIISEMATTTDLTSATSTAE
ncbi:MAG: hypothetical protein HY226_03790, partial [Candidatus Vogelbacteria bacterium]|nr:hypothetical protein [Candidatus Vogelbacteria bacterium]